MSRPVKREFDPALSEEIQRRRHLSQRVAILFGWSPPLSEDTMKARAELGRLGDDFDGYWLAPPQAEIAAAADPKTGRVPRFHPVLNEWPIARQSYYGRRLVNAPALFAQSIDTAMHVLRRAATEYGEAALFVSASLPDGHAEVMIERAKEGDEIVEVGYAPEAICRAYLRARGEDPDNG